MDKLKIKRYIKMVAKDLEYYMKEYDISQKEAYEILYERYYICMRLSQSSVEVEARERIHNSFKQEDTNGKI